MRPATTLLLAVPGGRQGMLGIQDAIDLGSGRRQSRQAPRPLTARGKIGPRAQEPTQDSTASHLDDLTHAQQ